MMPHSLFETLELLPLFLLTPKNVGQVEDMPRADDMAPLPGDSSLCEGMGEGCCR